MKLPKYELVRELHNAIQDKKVDVDDVMLEVNENDITVYDVEDETLLVINNQGAFNALVAMFGLYMGIEPV